MNGVVWRPVTGVPALYPWSLLWSRTLDSAPVRALLACARVVAAERRAAAWEAIPAGGAPVPQRLLATAGVSVAPDR
jgi:hypothetical protein